MAPRGYVTPSSYRSRSRTPYAPQSQRSRRRTPVRVYATVPRRVFRPLSNNAVHEFKHTLLITCPVTYCLGTGSTRGLILPGTTANTSNWGLRWSFTPSGCTVVNANNGVASRIFNNQTSYTNIFQEVRIKYVTIHVYFSANTANTNLSTTVSQSHFLPVLVSAVVYDLNEPVPATAATLLDYPNAISRQTGCSTSRDGSLVNLGFQPRTFSSLTGSNPQNIVPRGSWLSVDNGGILQDHAGALMALDEFNVGELQPNGTYGGSFSFHVEMSIEYKGLK